MRNIELKARCTDLNRAALTAEATGAKRIWVRRQTDTYFRVPSGRLKLRVEEPGDMLAGSYADMVARPGG